MKLEVGWRVYYITEKFKPYGFHIAKCEVKKVPIRKGHKEYCLIEKPWKKPLKMYWVPAKNIHLTYEEAVTAAEKIADKYDRTWGWMETCHREWRD